MLWTIIKKELLLNIMTFKFAVGTVVCVLLTAVFTPVLLKDYGLRLDNYSANVAANRAQLQKVMVYKNITPTVYRRPSPLSIFAEGLAKRLSHEAPIRFERIPILQTELLEDNPFLAIFPSMDIALLFKIVVSILALLVAHDTVCGEREKGTLMVILSASVPRYRILLAKTGAGLTTVAVPVTLAFMVAACWLESSPAIRLMGADWLRMGLIYGASLLFVFVMFALGLLCSCLMRKSAVALNLGLLCWVWFVVIVPNGAVRLATHWRHIDSLEQYEARIEAIHQKHQQEHGEYVWPMIQAFRSTVKDRERLVVSGGKGAFGRGYAKVVSKAYVPERIKRATIAMDVRHADDLHQVENKMVQDLLGQRQLAVSLARWSPACLYGNILRSLAGTDLNNHQHFLDRAKVYRRHIVDYIHSHTDGFTTPSLVTACTEQDMIETGDRYKAYKSLQKQAETEEEKRQIRNDSWGAYIESKVARQSPLDLSDLPRFDYQPSIGASTMRVIWDLLLMVLIGVALWMLGLIFFQRYDIRMSS